MWYISTLESRTVSSRRVEVEQENGNRVGDEKRESGRGFGGRGWGGCHEGGVTEYERES